MRLSIMKDVSHVCARFNWYKNCFLKKKTTYRHWVVKTKTHIELKAAHFKVPSCPRADGMRWRRHNGATFKPTFHAASPGARATHTGILDCLGSKTHWILRVSWRWLSCTKKGTLWQYGINFRIIVRFEINLSLLVSWMVMMKGDWYSETRHLEMYPVLGEKKYIALVTLTYEPTPKLPPEIRV